MRKAIFTFFLLLGIGCGLLSARKDDWGTQLVMMAIGAMAGGAIGGALSQIGKSGMARRREADEDLRMPPGGLGISSRDRAANFWRDECYMPNMKPPRSEHGSDMCESDKNL